jgi:FkbM family methyltransferase
MIPGFNLSEIDFLLKKFKVEIKGILHVGAHECEELDLYSKYTNINNIIWVEALPYLVEQNLKKNPNLKIINAVVSNTDGQMVDFNITNNIKSSSMLDLKYHKEIHPNVEITDTITLKSKTIQKLYLENNIKKDDNNFLVLDIQGAELLALKGMGDILDNIEAIYIEVNEKELYEGCCTLTELDNFLFDLNYDRKYLMTLNGYGNAFYLKNN